METVFSNHPYFFTNLITFILVHSTARIFLDPARKRSIILSGVINMNAFPFLVFLEGAYWSPIRFGGGLLGIEDALCSYDVSALLWLVLCINLTFSEGFQPQWKRLILRLLTLGLIISVVFICGCLLGLRGMTSLLVTQLVILPLLYFLRPNAWRLSLKAMLLYPLLYLALVRVYFWIWPDFLNQWNLGGPWGTVFLGLPIGELIWAAGFSLWWPPFFTYICGWDIERKGQWGLVLVAEA